MRERRALLTAVRAAILRVAFFADVVLAIKSSWVLSGTQGAAKCASVPGSQMKAAATCRQSCALYSADPACRQRDSAQGFWHTGQ
jgi:hypothetical protein